MQASVKFPDLDGGCYIDEIRRLADRIAPTDLNVMISGEPGSGRARLAKRIFSRSKRRSLNWLRVDSGRVAPGRIVDPGDRSQQSIQLSTVYRSLVDGRPLPYSATLFFHEVGELDARSQSCLLLLMQLTETHQLTGADPAINVRIIASSSANLIEEIALGNFRADLFYRLKVGHVSVPPLREHRSDLPMLVADLVERYSSRFRRDIPLPLDSKLLQEIASYSWPGNLHELEDFAKSLVGLGSAALGSKLLAQKMRSHGEGRLATVGLRNYGQETQRRVERRVIQRALDEAGWDRRQAARLLQMSYQSLLSKIRELSIH